MLDLLTLDIFLSFITLAGLEIILGIDNLIFIALVSESLPREKRQTARMLGLSLALIMRIIMLFGASTAIAMTKPLFFILGFGISGRSLLLFFGGLFLIIKCSKELYDTFDEFSLYHIKEKTETSYQKSKKYKKAFHVVIGQIIIVDFIFSFDSIIVAVGMVDHLPTIVAAVVVAMIVMLISMKAIADFISANPAIKVIAIAFIYLIGFFLLLQSFGLEIPKAYLYFAMFFSITSEVVNIRLRAKREKFVAAGGKILHH